MTPATKKALGCVDWGQVVANGGPPCFHVESGRFCLRAERWGGHNLPEAKADIGHNFVSLDTFCEAESKLAAAAERETIISMLWSKRDRCEDIGKVESAQTLDDLMKAFRSFSPADVLEAHDQAVRLEALKWSLPPSINPHKVDYHQRRVILEIERLAALRATPQPTAVKEPNNG